MPGTRPRQPKAPKPRKAHFPAFFFLRAGTPPGVPACPGFPGHPSTPSVGQVRPAMDCVCHFGSPSLYAAGRLGLRVRWPRCTVGDDVTVECSYRRAWVRSGVVAKVNGVPVEGSYTDPANLLKAARLPAQGGTPLAVICPKCLTLWHHRSLMDFLRASNCFFGGVALVFFLCFMNPGLSI